MRIMKQNRGDCLDIITNSRYHRGKYREFVKLAVGLEGLVEQVFIMPKCLQSTKWKSWTEDTAEIRANHEWDSLFYGETRQTLYSLIYSYFSISTYSNNCEFVNTFVDVLWCRFLCSKSTVEWHLVAVRRLKTFVFIAKIIAHLSSLFPIPSHIPHPS